MTMRAPKFTTAFAILLATAAVGLVAARTPGESNTPQGRGPAKARQAAAAANAAAAAPAPAPAEGNKVLEDVHKQEEVSASGKGLTYDPGDRRDPFISPSEANKIEDVGKCEGEGVECWLITEVNLVGMLARRSGGVALVIGPEGYGASLKAGDKLYDGEVLRVDASTGTVVFRQKVNDPTRIKPYRDIEKKLNTTREGGV
jgi:Tfp pilus assembly protein PilP